ncbi:DNA helicase UvrD, partial [Aeromicrobium phragmitis]
RRVDERLDAAGIDPSGLGASTFHAFGLNVIGKATGRKPRLAPWLDGGQDVAMVSRIVDELRDRSPDFRFKWDMYRLLFARMADDPAGGEPDAYDYVTRATGFRTFNGETVKSQGERMIADFLFLNGVTYEY